MKLNIEHITENGRFWSEVNALAKEAFPPQEYLAPSKLVEMAKADNFEIRPPIISKEKKDVNFIFETVTKKQVCF